jgi:hypothetical protein
MRRRPDEGAENALSLEPRLTAIGGKRTLTGDEKLSNLQIAYAIPAGVLRRPF